MILEAASAVAIAGAVLLTAPGDPAPDKIDAIFARFNRPNVPGCAVAIDRDGRQVFAKGYGLADMEQATPITPRTIFHVASLSKEVTAFAIQLLADDGKLNLDDDIRKVLPEMHDFGQPITVRNLLHHTSGLRDQWDLVSMGGWRMSDVITQEDLLGEIFRQERLNFPPGSHFDYCNSGYTLLATIVERVSGKKFRDFCQARIFKPLGMTQTFFHDDCTEIVPGRARSYNANGRRGFRNAVLSYSNVGATSLFTTVEDFGKWAANFLDPKIGGARIRDRMLETPPLNDGRSNSYASGIAVGTYRGLRIYEHGGADAGFRTEVLIFPDQKLTVQCFANVGSADPTALARRVADLYLGSEMKSRPRAAKPIKIDASKFSAYLGTYEFDPSSVGTFSVKDGKLEYVDAVGAPIEMIPVAENHFRVAGIGEFDFGIDGAQPTMISGYGSVTGQRVGASRSGTDLDAYVGDYFSSELLQLYRVRLDKSGLVVWRLKGEGPLNAIAADRFECFGYVAKFERDATGQPVRMLLSGDRSFEVRFDRVTMTPG